jgi:type IV pilus assembly protein PilB
MPYEIDYMEKRMLGMPIDEKITLFRPTGCNSCNQGFRGRTAVHEIMPIDESIRRLIDSNATTDNIREKAIEEGMTTLFQSALDLALQGKTTFSEVMRVGFTL